MSNVYIFRYFYKVPLFLNKGKLYTVCVNLENVCLDGCEATVVPFLELNSILEILVTVLTVKMTAYKARVNYEKVQIC